MINILPPFSRAAADFLNEIDVLAFEIGSGEADNLPLIRHIARFGKPVMMSTDMQSIETIKASVDILVESGVEFALLECTNLYPSPPGNVSLHGVSQSRGLAWGTCWFL
jgi:N-acetylneuraminate synthase